MVLILIPKCQKVIFEIWLSQYKVIINLEFLRFVMHLSLFMKFVAM